MSIYMNRGSRKKLSAEHVFLHKKLESRNRHSQSPKLIAQISGFSRYSSFVKCIGCILYYSLKKEITSQNKKFTKLPILSSMSFPPFYVLSSKSLYVPSVMFLVCLQIKKKKKKLIFGLTVI